MILSLSGQMHSGKDLVAKIIQYLTTEASEAGKAVGMHCTIQEYLLKGDNSCNDVYQIKKFAYKLKQIATILTGVPIERWEDQDFKKTDMPDCWDVLKQVSENEPDGNSVGDGYLKVPMTYREFLQKLGTEAVRDGLHTNTWVNALFADYKNKWENLNPQRIVASEIPGEELPNWIITDTRFPNEFEAIKKRGGICVRVERDAFTYEQREANVHFWGDSIGNQMAIATKYTKQEAFNLFSYHQLKTGRNYGKGLHPSETSLDQTKFDYYLCNSGSIEDLIEEVRKMLVHFKLLEHG